MAVIPNFVNILLSDSYMDNLFIANFAQNNLTIHASVI